MDTSHTVSERMTRTAWERREAQILRFEEAWQRCRNDRQLDLPEIRSFLLSGGSDDRESLLLELIKIDLEYRWKSGRAALCEDYYELAPEFLSQPAIQRDLLGEELNVRKSLGQLPELSDWLRRFPDCADMFPPVAGAALTKIDDSTIPDIDTAGLTDDAAAGAVSSGDRIGRYRLVEVVGRGAFADVWRAEDVDLNRSVAIKLLRLSMSNSDGATARFFREARTLAKLNHPAIVKVHEVGQFGQRPFIVSEFIAGSTLETHLSNRPVSIAEACRLAQSVAEGLECAHRQGIVHRDVKPANVLMTASGDPLLTDFGLARVEEQLDATLTQQGDVLGTPAYMSPEQALGQIRLIDARADVYALGVILYRMVSGRLPFEGKASSVLYSLVNQSPQPLTSIVDSVPRDLATIIGKCLEKVPADRYDSAQALAEDLRRFRHGEPITARRAGWIERSWKWALRHPRFAAALAAVMLLSSFSLGTLWQLRSVRSQRDRARVAEEQSADLLSQSSAAAGLLAMQRGKPDDAVQHFTCSIRLNYPQASLLKLKVIEALVSARRLEEATEKWLALSPATLPRQLAGQYRLWEAELTMEGMLTDRDEIALLEQSIDGGLPDADRAYAVGNLAETTPDAVRALQEAIAINPFHHRARRMLIAALFSLGEFEASANLISTSRHLFPEDIDFALMQALTDTALGDLESGLEALRSLPLPEEERSSWQAFCEIVYFLTQEMESDLESVQRRTAQISQDFVRRFQPLLVARGIRFVPKVKRQFAALPKLLADTDDENYERLGPELERLSSIHPEGSLFLLTGGSYLSRDDVAAALTAYQAVVKYPAFIKDADIVAKLAISAAAMKFWLRNPDESSQYRELFLSNTREIDFDKINMKPEWGRLFVVGALRLDDFELADKLFPYWPDSSSPQMKFERLWHQAILARHQKRYVMAIKSCDEMLKIFPDHSNAEAFRESLVKHLKGLISAATVDATVPMDTTD